MVYEADKHNLDGTPVRKKVNFTDAQPTVVQPSNLYPAGCGANKTYPTDQDLSTALAYSYSGSALPGVTWPRDLSMMPYARAVMCFYSRSVPGPNSGSKWADRADLFFFDAAVKYFKKYGYQYTYTQGDCYALTDMAASLDTERTNITQLRLAGGLGEGEENTFLNILNDLQTNANSNIAKLGCAEYISQNEQSQFSDTQISNLQKVNQITQAGSATTKYLIYGMLIVTVVIAGVIIFKKGN